MNIDISQLGLTTLASLQTNSRINPVLVQEQIEETRKFITERTVAMQGYAATAKASSEAAAASTVAAAKQMAENVKSQVETAMKALEELSKSDPTVLLSF